MLAMYWQSSPISKSQYDVYSGALREINNANIELEQLHQEEATLQQLATYSALVAGSSTPITAGLLELSAKCHEEVKRQEVYTILGTIDSPFNSEFLPLRKPESKVYKKPLISPLI